MDEFAAFREKVAAEKKASEDDFDTSCDVIFNYGYGCCAFAHNICGSKPRIPAGMPDTTNPLPPRFFVNPRCPLSTFSSLPAAKPVAAIREGPPAESPPTAKDGLDVPPGASTKANKEANLAAKG